MEVELLHLTPNAEEFIGRCASICYDSSQDSGACVKRAAACVSKGHLATLRFAHATFKVKGISRACSHQFVRSKHLDFLQRSQRYCSEKDVKFIYPTAGDPTIYNKIYSVSLDAYKALLDAGIRKEDARFVLPEATCTELIVTGNLQGWLDFINLRSGKEVQWEIREVARSIQDLLMQQCPTIFKEIE